MRPTRARRSPARDRAGDRRGSQQPRRAEQGRMATLVAIGHRDQGTAEKGARRCRLSKADSYQEDHEQAEHADRDHFFPTLDAAVDRLRRETSADWGPLDRARSDVSATVSQRGVASARLGGSPAHVHMGAARRASRLQEAHPRARTRSCSPLTGRSVCPYSRTGPCCTAHGTLRTLVSITSEPPPPAMESVPASHHRVRGL